MAQNSARASAPAPLITQAVDESDLVTLKGSVTPLAMRAADQGAAPDSLALGRTILVLKSSAVRQAALKQFLNDQQNSRSPSYHKWLSPTQFGERYGASPQDIQKINQWLESHGFTVEAPTPGRNLVIFSGTHAQLKAAFHTELHHYMVNGKLYWANATDPQIPAALAPVVSGFSSLNNFPRRAMHTEPKLLRRDQSAWKQQGGTGRPQPNFTITGSGQSTYALAPYDLATIYNVLPLWNAGIDGTGQTIAIVSNSDINPSDVDYFRKAFGLPPTKLNIIYYGSNPGPNGDEGEADLDVEWSGAMAKNATIDLVVAADGATSGGIDGAAIYIINNNLASILNVSYGECELGLGTNGNQFFSEIWEQAAAQGITVTTSTGDAGSAGCDQDRSASQYGLAVSGIASTPYTVAVGGTDFYGTYLDPGRYWNSTNDPNTYESALSYIQELPWNDSCASPQLLTVLQAQGVPDTTPEALCNDVNEQGNVLNTAGGSGGASNCATSDATGQCQAGNQKPAWQSGVPGIPSDGVRDLPDVSLMAGNGEWGSLYLYCQSDGTSNGQCDVNTSLEGAGGTSFASPIFAGVMALVQQKTSSQQGNANYVLYKLATSQYAGNNAAACSSSSVVAGNACLFYDVTDGTNAMPCFAQTTDCTTTVPTDAFGILPGYAATSGYDLATGLGSVNVYNLVENWSTAAGTFLPTSTAVTTSAPTTASYGSSLSLNVSVAVVAPATGTPSGDIAITSNSNTPNSISVAAGRLSNGNATIAAALIPGGTYQLFARYAGDSTFAPSQSAGLNVTITPAVLSGVTLSATRTTVASGQNVSLSLTIPGLTGGMNPTGTATFTDSTTGVVLGTAGATANAGNVTSTAFITVTTAQLQSGGNNIVASYSGDSNYGPATSAVKTVTLSTPFTIAINPVSLTLAPNGSGSVTVTVAPVGAAPLSPTALNFSCPATLPVGLACSFSKPAAGSNGGVTSILSLQLASPLYQQRIPGLAGNSRSGWLGAGSVASLACLLMFGLPGRRRRATLMMALIAFSSVSFMIGCGGGGSGSVSSSNPKPTLIATTTSLAATTASPTLNNPVTLTAQVAPASGTGSPTGTVTFSAGSTSLGSATLASGSATLTSSALPVGTQSIIATYGGDSTYSGSTSSASSLDVAFTATIAVTAADTLGDTSSANLALTVQ